MKTLLLYLFVFLSTQLPKPANEWYTYQNQQFSIEFPQEPEVTVQKVPTSIGDIEMKIASYEGSGKGDVNLAYVFISSIYPDSVINSGSKEKLPGFFRSSIDGAVKNVNGNLLSEKVVTLNGFPGREAKVDYGNGLAIIAVRMFLVKNHVYFVQTISEAGKADNEHALRFHRSFKLKNPG
jgi:hypothetical protein